MRGVTNVLKLLAIAVFLVACAPWQPAPVEDRRDSAGSASPQAGSPARHRASGPVPPFHEVGRGDTLYSIAFRYGLDWRSVAQWNRIQPPYTIRPGQELRLSAPPDAVATTRPEPSRPSPASREPSSPPDPTPATPSPPRDTTPAQRPAPASTGSAAPPAASAATRDVAGVTWRWPTTGNIERRFDPAATRRGIGIAGEVGQLVLAAADGQVVYSGTALIGYGELIIIKHSDTMLSAYGHNRRRLVTEGDRVRAGQPIAEMGMNESQRALLHFEVRRNGQPEDPMAFLPPR